MKRIMREYTLHLQDDSEKYQDIEMTWDMSSNILEAIVKGSEGTIYENGYFYFKIIVPE